MNLIFYFNLKIEIFVLTNKIERTRKRTKNYKYLLFFAILKILIRRQNDNI